jgi:RNA polymerase sigma factor (sigma-70 family)
MATPESADGSVKPDRLFATTHWSAVIAAGQNSGPGAHAALEELCQTYWYPLYAYVRRLGHSAADAEDLTQEFFSRLLSKDYLARADPQKGKFRSFLLTGLKRLLSDEWDRANRLKRGGGKKTISFDAAQAESRYQLEPVDDRSPDYLFERSWAAALLERAAWRLQEEYAAAGKSRFFEQLTEFRTDSDEQRSYSEVAAQFGLGESAMKSAIYRFRRRHHELVREEIAQTVGDPAEVDEEVRYLLSVIAH